MSDTMESCPEPQPLAPEMPTAEPYPVDALGNTLAQAAFAMRRIIKAPMALCVHSVLAAANLAVQRLYDVEIDGRRYPTSLYLLDIALTGERKSSCDKAACVPIDEYEKELRSQFIARNAEHQKENTPPPAPPILRVGDVTMEGLQRVYAEGAPALGLFNDEGGTVFGGWSMNTEQAMKSAADLSRLWDGRLIVKARGGEGSCVLANRRLCLHLQAQPIIAHSVLSNGLLQGQGLLTRFLLAWPESTQGTRLYNDSEILSDTNGMKNFYKHITELLRYSIEVTLTGELQPKLISIEKEARLLWIEFHNSVETELKRGGKLELIRGFAAKAGEHCLRIAANLIAVNGEAPVISIDSMQDAIELTSWYLNESLRIAAPQTMAPDLEAANQLLGYIGRQKKSTITLQEIYQKGPRSLRCADKARRAVDVLVEKFWLKEIDHGEWDIHSHAVF